VSILKSDEELFELYIIISKDKGQPLNHWEVTALLETYGLRDIDAKNEYGFENLFDMAKYMFPFVQEKKGYKVKSIQAYTETNMTKRVIKNYIKGLAFSLPMLVQIVFTLAVGYAIWTSMHANIDRATAISLGTFAALVITGGSAQAIGRKGLFYLKLDEFLLARNVSLLLFGIGVVLIFVMLFFLTFINFFFDLYPVEMYNVAATYYILLAFFFLSLSIFYMFEDYLSIVLLTFSGLMFVYILHTMFKLTVPTAQIYGLVGLNILVMSVGFFKLMKLKDKNSSAEGSILPKPSILFYSLLPYYSYGFFYFTFLIIDRLVAWSAQSVSNPYVVWFNINYELGLDWALVALIFLMGTTEVSIAEFMYRVNDRVTKIRYDNTDEFTHEIYSFFKKFNLSFMLFSIIIILATYLVVYVLYEVYYFQFLENFMQQPTLFIFYVAAFSYFLLVNSLMNTLFMFSLSRHHMPLKAVAYALFANFFVGMILSRLYGYEYAVFGLLAGSIILWIMTFLSIREMFKKLDYYYYSAY